MKKLLYLILFFSLGFGLLACTGSTDTTTPPTPPSTTPTPTTPTPTPTPPSTTPTPTTPTPTPPSTTPTPTTPTPTPPSTTPTPTPSPTPTPTPPSTTPTSISYTITFVTNGGESISPIQVDDGQTVTLSIPLKMGHSFIGWFSSDGQNSAQFSDATPVINDLTLYARWQINQYTITFDGAGVENYYSLILDFDSLITLPEDPIRKGYTFLGWIPDLPMNMPATDINLTSNWERNKYKITFNSNGGTPVDAITLNFDNEILDPTIPEKFGFEFEGWYLDEEFNEIFISKTMPDQDINLYAKWAIQKYTITFFDYIGAPIKNYKIQEGMLTTEVELPKLENEGYQFISWSTNIPVLMPSNDLEIRPIYEVNKYSLIFNNSFGEAFELQEVDYGQNLHGLIYPNPPPKEGYIYLGYDGDRPDTMPSNNLIFNPLYISNHPLENLMMNIKITLEHIDYLVFADDTHDWSRGLIVIRNINNSDYERRIVGPSRDTNLGSRLIAQGDYLIITAKNYGSDNLGAIFIYKFSDPTYERKIVGQLSSNNTFFGNITSATDDFIAISAPGYDNQNGRVYIYSLSDPSYEKVIDGNGGFGTSMEFYQNYLIISEPTNNSLHIYDAIFFDNIRTISENYPYFGFNFVIHQNYISIMSNFEMDEIIHIYKLDNPDFYRMIATTCEDLPGNRCTLVQQSEDYVVVTDQRRVIRRQFFPAANQWFSTYYYTLTINIHKLSDENYHRTINVYESRKDWGHARVYLSGDYIIVGDKDYSISTQPGGIMDDRVGRISIFKLSKESYERHIVKSEMVSTYSERGFGGNIEINDKLIFSHVRLGSSTATLHIYSLNNPDLEMIQHFESNSFDFRINGYLKTLSAGFLYQIRDSEVYLYKFSF